MMSRILSLVPVLACAAAALKPLTFTKDGKFQIAVLEDLHYGEAPSTWGPIQDAATTKVISDILDRESATDFVVFNGDLISRDANLANDTNKYIDQILGPVVNRSLSFATLYGNHDPGYNRSLEQMLAHERLFPGSRTKSQVTSLGGTLAVGLSNYVLPVYGEDCPTGCGCTPEMLIWFFDSRSGFEYQQLRNGTGARIDRQPWVSPEVVEWFTAEKTRLTTKFGRVIPSIAFVHIPPNVFTAVNAGPGIDPQRNPGINDMEITGQAYGWCANGTKNANCAWGGQDVPFMKAISSTEGLMGLFSAHIHGTTWCYKWTKDSMPGYAVQPTAHGGLNICFGQHTGYGGAGDWERGARQLRVTKQDGELKLDTWIRLESGKSVGAVSLNSTFGQDLYPQVPVTKTFCEECATLGKPVSPYKA